MQNPFRFSSQRMIISIWRFMQDTIPLLTNQPISLSKMHSHPPQYASCVTEKIDFEKDITRSR